MAFRTKSNPIETPEKLADGARPTTSVPAYQASAGGQTPPPIATSSPALSESATMARDLKDGTLSGFLGAGIELKGEISFKELMRIDGHFNGKINSEEGKLIVGDKGLVEAEVVVAIAHIQGTVNGNVSASQRIELGRASKVTGDIQTPVLMVEEGAIFDGNCRMTK